MYKIEQPVQTIGQLHNNNAVLDAILRTGDSNDSDDTKG